MTATKPVKTRMIPPDGGWGWVVLGSALVVNFLIPGTVKSFGVLFVEFLQVFKASPTAASWMPALCYFLYSSLGPLSSVLSMKYSYKTVTIIGGTFAASGMMLSYFANSVSYLYVSYGLMVGIGAGLSFPPTVYIVTSYFERLRGFANGLCISGSAIGTIVLPPFLQYLLDHFGYRGAVLIMGAITLNTLVCGMLYHPVENHMKLVPIGVEEGIDNEALNLEESPQKEEIVDKSVSNPEEPKSESAEVLKQEPKQEQEQKQEKEKEDSTEAPKITLENEIPVTISRTGSLKRIFRSESFKMSLENSDPKSKNKDQISPKFQASRKPKTEKLEKKNRKSSSRRKAENAKECSSSSSSSSSNSSSKGSSCGTKRFFDLSVLRDPIYLVILISNSTSAISNTNFMILLPSYAISEGFDRNSSALLLSIVSALDLVGRIGGASLSDIDFIPKYYYFVCGLGTSGIALALLPMASSYSMLSFFCALFGLSSGMYIGITTVILADMLGTEKLSSSYGISLFVNGVLQLIGPPLCGVIFENVGSYKPIFLAFGIILILGTALWAAVPIIKRNAKKDIESA